MSTPSSAKPTRIVTLGRVMVVLAIVAAFALGLANRRGGNSPSVPEAGHTAQDHQAETIWTCSMHPQIKLPKPGQCPICFMDLIPLENGGDEDLGPRTLVMSAGAAALAEIQTVAVQRKSAEALVSLIGKVTYDETLYKTIAAWIPGRLDTLFVDFTGTQVAQGEHLASLYSPDLYAGQVELLSAINASAALQSSADPVMRRTAASTVASARERLRLWGLSAVQIQNIEASGQPRHHLDISSPLSGVVVHKNATEGMYVGTGTTIYTVADLSRVWVTLEAYEADLIWLRVGQAVDFTVEAMPGQFFQGEIAFIDPVLDPKTRTVGVRLNVDNSEGRLKPGMFVNATVGAILGAQSTSETGVGDQDLPLIIPASAALITGKRAVVYVRVPGHEKPTFEGREVVLGPRAGDTYVVAAGLQEGELVVTRGNFKIDSALQIQAKPSMMSHDGGEPTSASTGESFEAPLQFKTQLGGVMDRYLVLQAALAKDDDEAARSAALAAGQALQAVDMLLLSGDAHLAWMQYQTQLSSSFTAMAEAKDLEGRRQPFLKLVAPLWDALNRFGFQPTEPLRRFNCPMANNDQGGDWIQLERETSNPYFGASMLRCGSQVDSLTTASGEEGR